MSIGVFNGLKHLFVLMLEKFEAVSRFSAEEKKVLKSLLDSMILTHEARRWSSG